MPTPPPAPPRSSTRRRAAASPSSSYCRHRSDCPPETFADGTQWRALAPAGQPAQLHEWQIQTGHASTIYQTPTPLSLLLHQGAGLMRWVVGAQSIQTAMVPGDVLLLPAGTKFQFSTHAVIDCIFFVNGAPLPSAEAL